jgi:hypothetical protein
VSDLTVIQAFLGGTFALLGGFFGAWLTRRTEYEKWLRQQRSLEFAAFLRCLHEVRLEASNAFYSTEGTELSRSTQATEIFLSLRKYESVARLYMSESGRDQLSTLTKTLWLNCTAKGGPANYGEQIKSTEAAIQELFEKELELIPGKFRWLIVGMFSPK